MRRHLVAPCLLLLVAGCGDDPTSAGHGWAAVAAGEGFTCALKATGAAWCWGIGSFGQLGNGATESSPVPVEVTGNHRFRSIVAGSAHACGLESGGQLWCWGRNDFFELGAPTAPCDPGIFFFRCSSSPVRAEAVPRLNSVTASGYLSCGLTLAGAGLCWGWNTHGQAGSGNPGEFMGAPLPVTGGHAFASISLGPQHVCAIESGAAFCWGANYLGQAGIDSSASQVCGVDAVYSCVLAPTRAAPGLVVQAVSAGGSHTCALSNGAAWCWGSVAGGASPAPVGGAHNFTAIDAGHDHTCALDGAGEAWCWGPADALTPVRVDPSLRFRSIAAGVGHTCAVATDASIWCWGLNATGQLGNASNQSSSVPVLVQ